MSAALILEKPARRDTAAAVDAPRNWNMNTNDALLDLQLGVARRADELARRFRPSHHSDRRLWLRAEQEIFERVENAARVTAR